MDGQSETVQPILREATVNDATDGAQAERLQALERELEEARASLASEQRGRSIDKELLIAGVLDLVAARALVEKELEQTPDIRRAVARVRQHSPGMFRRAMPAIAGATQARNGPGEGIGAELESAQREALQSGDRKALLRYLRLRREG